MIIKLNESTLFSMGFDRVSIEALRHFLRQVGEISGGTTLPEVAALQGLLQIDTAFSATPKKLDDCVEGAFQVAPASQSKTNGIEAEPLHLAAQVAELGKQIADLQQQLASAANASAQVAEVLKYAQHLEVTYALAPVAQGVDWTRPGRIGSSTASTGAFTTLSASGQITSTLATGTAPLVIASTTQVSNLNVSQLVGATWVAPGAIGSTTRNTGAFSTFFVNVTSAEEAGSRASFVNANSTEYSFPTIWAGHSTQKDLSLYNGATTGANGAAAVLFVNTRNSGTSRSINAAGTINASGTDYAEYMLKAADCGDVAKGQIVGIDATGKVTDKWAAAVAFAIKSTNPSYVGGDTWGTADAIGERPVLGPRGEDEPDAEYMAREDAFDVDLVSYESDLESARRSVDRIAFSGRVPCNVLGATPGHYIVAMQDGAGIKGVSIAAPTLDEYMRAVGRVIAIELDGRAQVVVKIG